MGADCSVSTSDQLHPKSAVKGHVRNCQPTCDRGRGDFPPVSGYHNRQCRPQRVSPPIDKSQTLSNRPLRLLTWENAGTTSSGGRSAPSRQPPSAPTRRPWTRRGWRAPRASTSFTRSRSRPRWMRSSRRRRRRGRRRGQAPTGAAYDLRARRGDDPGCTTGRDGCRLWPHATRAIRPARASGYRAPRARNLHQPGSAG